MKKLALVLLVMGVMVLGFGLLTASAQDTSGTASQTANTTVTVTVTDSNVTVSPNTLPLNVPVTFNFTNNGSNAHAFVIEKEGANNVPLTSGSNTASFNAIAAGGSFSTTWTFTEAGSYQLAAYNNGTLEQGLVATFTVAAAQGDATATVSPTAEATASPTVAATSTTTATTAVTTTTTTTDTTSGSSAATTGASPSSLPTTGGESNWAAMLLAFGVAALLLGGALTFARRAR
ncbi:MAG: cupredoxin domain-containing protein [Anaerolineae bacterium]|jgi:LPXTG-motif cell wall-anchored protein|nr:cupredoxin domain-containing protein [Anaerolineae bacterium]